MDIDINDRGLLEIDPSIILDGEVSEIINCFKIKLASYKDNDEIVINLYFTMKTYFNDVVIDDILQSILDKSEIRNLKLKHLGI